MRNVAARTERDFKVWLHRLPLALKMMAYDDLKAAFQDAYAMGEQRGEVETAQDLAPQIQRLEAEAADRRDRAGEGYY